MLSFQVKIFSHAPPPTQTILKMGTEYKNSHICLSSGQNKGGPREEGEAGEAGRDSQHYYLQVSTYTARLGDHKKLPPSDSCLAAFEN